MVHNLEKIYFGMGCFWGAQKLFDKTKGVIRTTVGYGGGDFENPTYKDVCSGKTGHRELVEVEFNNDETSLKEILKVFFEFHTPTQKDGQANDIGDQYKSCIYYLNMEQKEIIENQIVELQKNYEERIATEVLLFKNYYLAEDSHQKYLDKNPGGYCHIKFD